MVLIVAAVGKGGSGKTVTLEYLVSKLSSEGFKVGSIKHVHHKGFTMDKEGTNTWRYAQAGAKVIVAISPEEVDIIKKIELAFESLEEITGLLKNEKLDVIFIEGFHTLIGKRQDVPKIITAVDETDLQQTLKGTVEPIIAIAGKVALNISSSSMTQAPFIKIPSEGQKLAELIKQCLQKTSS